MDKAGEKETGDQVKPEPAEVKTENEENTSVESNSVVIKAEPPSEELLEKIKKQVEFYFGDINMQRDKFLLQQTKLEDGWIPMSVMLNFKLLASMSSDPEDILKALESSELMEISDDRKKIRRSPKKPLPAYDEAYRKSQTERTVYVKGFPLTGITIQNLKEFFKEYEPIENIIMRKYQDKEKQLKFKGSIYVQFQTLEGAKAFMTVESVKYNDAELIRKWSAEYAIEQAEELKLKKQKKSETHAPVEESRKGLPKGTLVHFSGTDLKCNRESILEGLRKFGVEVAFIDYSAGDAKGWVRLQNENSAKTLIEKMPESKLKVKDDELSFKLVEGEEEENYLMEAQKKIMSKRSKPKMSKRGRGKKGGGGQRGRKRNGSPTVGGTPAKKAAAS